MLASLGQATVNPSPSLTASLVPAPPDPDAAGSVAGMRPHARAAGVALVAALVLPTLGQPANSASIPGSASTAATRMAAVSAVRAATSGRGPSKILLTPTADLATSQEVSWTMPYRVKGQRVQFRIAGQPIQSAKAARRPATKKKTAGSALPRYEATLTGLTPATTYRYRVVTRIGSSPWRSFTTANPAAPITTLIALGDTQVDNRGVPKRTLKRALTDAPAASLVLQAGDVVNNPTKAKQWDDLLAAIGDSGRTRNWVVSIGNHEQCVLITCESNAGEGFRSYFDGVENGFPAQGQTWYAMDYQGIRIVVLDSFGGRIAEQALFLDQALATNPNRWSIVLMHAPPFASRPERSNPEIVAQWLPIIEARNVDLVLTGHDHSYARGYYRKANGPVFATSVSGPKYYDVTDADWAANKARRVVWAAQTSTYQVITVAGDQLQYRAVVSARGSNSTSPFGPGGVLDQFTIDKSSGSKVVR